MSEEYTPDTIEVLQRWRPDGPLTYAEVQEVDAEFWRWLRIIVEGSKADGFDDGWVARANRDPHARKNDAPPPPRSLNPYRTGS